MTRQVVASDPRRMNLLRNDVQNVGSPECGVIVLAVHQGVTPVVAVERLLLKITHLISSFC